MVENSQQIGKRIEGVLASEQWKVFIGAMSGRMSAGGTASFELKENLDNAVLTFILDYEPSITGPSLSTYRGKIVVQPAFEHTVVTKTDTAELERLMQRLDFKLDFTDLESKLAVDEKVRVLLIKEYHNALDNLAFLDTTEKGKPIADALKIKYLLDTPYEKGYLSENLKERFVTERTFNAEGRYSFSFREAINLLKGRSILKSYVTMDGREREGWFKADPGVIQNNTRYYFSGGQTILPNYDLAGLLRAIPLVIKDDKQHVDLIESLQCGDCCEVKAMKNDKEATYFIQADPGIKGLAIFDAFKRPIVKRQMLIGTGSPNKQAVRRQRFSKGL